LDKYVLRCKVKLPQSTHPVACALTSFGKALRDCADRLLRRERSRLDGHPTATRGNRRCLTIRATSDGDNPLGHGVSQLSPGSDEFIELLVQGSKELADDGPMQLLSNEPQVDQLDKLLLQQERDFFAYLAAEWWQVRHANWC
jgi:hypothetical protein